MQILKIKNYLLVNGDVKLEKIKPTLFEYLFELDLDNSLSWNRTRFLQKYLSERVNEVAKIRKEILEKNCRKDKEGKLIYLDAEGKEVKDIKLSVKYAIEDGEKMAKELTEYYDDDLIIDITPANFTIIDSIRRAIMQDKTTYKAFDAVRYGSYVDALEPVGAEVGKKENKKTKKNDNK